MANIENIVEAWKSYLDTINDWQILIEGVEPKNGSCGLVYELPNPIERPTESFAIADMRNLKFAEPHYHKGNETEIYIVLQGSGLIVVGNKETTIEKDSIVVIQPNTVHYTIPTSSLVLAAVNTPPFKPENYIVVTESNLKVGFDKIQFERLIRA